MGPEPKRIHISDDVNNINDSFFLKPSKTCFFWQDSKGITLKWHSENAMITYHNDS
jgi:hypothetical protein